MFPVEIFESTITKFAALMESLDIRFHLTGGMTSTAYGEPRMTQDIDIVVDPTLSKLRLDALVAILGDSDFLFHELTLRKAVVSEGMFQLLDKHESLKLDIYPREMIAGELGRSERLEMFAGKWFPVVSRFDAAASKLVWVSKGSHKSRRDLRAIFANGSGDDQQAIIRWASKSGYASLLEEVLQESNELE